MVTEKISLGEEYIHKDGGIYILKGVDEVVSPKGMRAIAWYHLVGDEANNSLKFSNKQIIKDRGAEYEKFLSKKCKIFRLHKIDKFLWDDRISLVKCKK
jgi:hypothetical protein